MIYTVHTCIYKAQTFKRTREKGWEGEYDRNMLYKTLKE